MAELLVVLSALLLVAAGVPAPAPVLRKLDDQRYQYARGPDGAHLVDLWGSVEHLLEASRFNPDSQIQYHLFTRQNPSVSQPLLVSNGVLLGVTNHNPRRRTIVLIHGWLDNAAADFNTVLVPAFLAAEDVNVIVVDWSAGAATLNYFTAVTNTVPAGEGIARFISSLNAATGTDIGSYHIVGHSLGGHAAGVAGRNLHGSVPYITGLEPMLTGWITNDDKYQPTDGVYTEVIHTNAGQLGYIATLAQVDFYPNGGAGMPGCSNNDCDHARSYFYMAESVTSGGFRGSRCLSYLLAMAGNCNLWGNLHMGGVVAKTGSTGVFYLETNASPPFSRT